MLDICELVQAKRKNIQPEESNSFKFLQKLGSSSGLIISIVGLLTIGASGGAWFNNILKNTEILDMKTQYSIEKIHKEEQVKELVDKIRSLSDSLNLYKKITNEK